MKVSIPFDEKNLCVEIPLKERDVTVLSSGDPPPSKDAETICRKALDHPIGQNRLSKIVSPKCRVAVLFDDFTRPTPVNKLMPLVLDELSVGGVQPEKIMLICANGMHDPAYMNANRLQQRVGHEVFEKYTVISHDAYDLKKLKFIGITQTLGTPLFINKAVAEADVKVAVGRVAPHGDMGYSGGYKMIMAGVSGIWSIIHNHTGSLSRRGVLNNPIREDADECGKMVGLNFILNVVYNSQGQTVHAFAGDPVKARLAAIKYGDRYVWGAKKPELADIVLASPGLGRGDYFMASIGGLGVALTCLKKGGTMIVAASCRQGWTTPEYLNSGWHVSPDLLQYDYPELQWLLASKAYNQPKFQFQALVYYVNHIVKNCQEHFVGLAGSKGVDPKKLKNIGMHFFESIDSALKYAIEKNGTRARITVIPDNIILPLNSFQTS